MKCSLFAIPLFLALAAPTSLVAQSATPQVKTVEPVTCKSRDTLTVTGENLDRATVAALYLTDGKNDTKVVMTEETATSIKLQVPQGVKPGRYALMILTKEKNPKLIEEPVKVTVE